ncbi:sulfite exporter TauE/SafE family protein [Actinocorallia populi]|uniref:sulfite exporter TauE/SafE family protein n=1 Tax=Actinocorallia populi TaxID=2079200 RepID=UPI000D08D927|nr:sulfite exporter TauE/SafE family protein [Actinocorallia populi]
MHFDFDVWMAFGSFLVAIVVGLTGMGGGALMTPMLMTFFGVPAITAISSDLVASAVMKPIGSFVHLRRGTVNLKLVGWLCVGSIPSAFCGVLIVTRVLPDGQSTQHFLEKAMGVALLIAAAGLIFRMYQAIRDKAQDRSKDERVTAEPGSPASQAPPELKVKPLPTVLTGVVGGVIVGITSVGSGSLIIVALLALYPMLKANQLVGTDLFQAVPLVIAAALGHILFGDFQLSVTAALLVGSIPGVYIGARISSRAPGQLIRRALAVVLLASALKLFGVPTVILAWTLLALIVVAVLSWVLLRNRARDTETADTGA